MISFSVKPRDNWTPAANGSCNSCCCEYAEAVPGETNKWRINYQPWLSGLRGGRLVSPTQISVEKLTPAAAPVSTTNLPPVNVDYTFHTPINAVLSGDVSVSASDPEAAPLTFALAHNGLPKHGAVSMLPTGAFTYAPGNGFVGYDTFYYSTSDGVNAPVNHAVMIAVDPALPAPALADPVLPSVVSVAYDQVRLDGGLMEFGLRVLPIATVGDVYRLTVKQTAMECDGGCYEHISCYDIHIVKC